MPRHQPHRRQAYYDDVLNITWLADANMRSVDILGRADDMVCLSDG